MSTKKLPNSWPQFIVSWDNTGLEHLIEIAEEEKIVVFEILKAHPKANPPKIVNRLANLISNLLLRARYNQQRHYEIYSFNAQKGITKDDILVAFNESPQTMADTIRKIGVKIHSDRALSNPKII